MSEQLIMVTRTPEHGEPESEWVTAGVNRGTLRLELDDGETIDLPADEVFSLFAPARRAAA